RRHQAGPALAGRQPARPLEPARRPRAQRLSGAHGHAAAGARARLRGPALRAGGAAPPRRRGRADRRRAPPAAQRRADGPGAASDEEGVLSGKATDMKVVLFCGGLGMRLRDYSESIPKPMVPVGYRPILWHVMRYYAHFGHKEFILCLGYRADTIKRYFLEYDETISNDFVMSEGGKKVDLLPSDIQD